MSVPAGSADNPVIIHIKPGRYDEGLYIQREKRFFRLVGEDAEKTVLTHNLNANMPGPDGKPIGTFRTASTVIDADDFSAENVTFENSAGPVGQALAIRVDGDRATFRNCRFLGYQDTILLNRGRQYFEDCYIEGAVDFIFGAATAFFEKCEIKCVKGGYITAASTPSDQPYGFVFDHCKIVGASPDVKSFLGRPWRQYGSTIFLNTEMSDVVRPEGWNDWKKPHETIRYAEFGSTGPGGKIDARVDWAKQLTAADAKAITVKKVLGGADGWDPEAPKLADVAAQNVRVKTDIVYSTVGDEKLMLNAGVPEGKGPFPIVILVHGGGWCSGNRNGDLSLFCKPLGEAQFTWFSIDYRLAPTNRWPACFDDLLTAIRWAKAHAAEYKGDPDRIALIGYSAGGQLVCLAGTVTNADTRVQAIVGCAPPAEVVTEAKRRGLDKWKSMADLVNSPILDANTIEALTKISPLEQIKPGMPPYLLIQGDADKTVLHEQTADFAEKLKAAGVPCEMITIPGAQHRIRDWRKFDPEYQAKMIAWLNKTLGRK